MCRVGRKVGERAEEDSLGIDGDGKSADNISVFTYSIGYHVHLDAPLSYLRVPQNIVVQKNTRRLVKFETGPQ